MDQDKAYKAAAKKAEYSNYDPWLLKEFNARTDKLDRIREVVDELPCIKSGVYSNQDRVGIYQAAAGTINAILNEEEKSPGKAFTKTLKKHVDESFNTPSSKECDCSCHEPNMSPCFDCDAKHQAGKTCCVCGIITSKETGGYENYQGQWFCWPCADGKPKKKWFDFRRR